MTLFHAPVLALAALAVLTAPAPAAAAPDQRSAAIAVGDLDLLTDEGQRILALRVRRAARAMCEAEAVGTLPRAIRGERRCIREAQANAAARARTMTAAAAATAGQGRGG